MMRYDLHTHTCFSHGKGMPEQNVEAALKAGLERIAITDHAPGHRAYGIKDVEGYFREISALKTEYAGRVEILAGMEFNILSLEGKTDLLEEYGVFIDIRLVGFHKFALARDFRSFRYFTLSSKKDVVKNTSIYTALAQSGEYDIITHPGYALKLDAKEFARACAEAGTLIEINEKHNDFSPDELYMAACEGAAFILSSDAHAPESVGKTPCAYLAAKQAGILDAVVNAVVSEDDVG